MNRTKHTTTMDPYALKQDNRNKFREKQRAKQRHATPSDRKYRALKRQEQASEQPQDDEAPDPPSNEYRYHDDVTMAYGQLQDEERNADANRRVKEALEGRGDDLGLGPEVPDLSGDVVTKKELDRMDVMGLNKVLGRQQAPALEKPLSYAAKSTIPSTKCEGSQKKESVKPNALSMPSKVPDDLQDDQDFLDGLL